jgi:transposase InsO family protein
MRLRAEHRNHVWSYDFVADRTSDGRPLRMLVVIDEWSRDCLLIHVARKMTAFDVLEQLADLFILHGTPECIRSDNGPECVAGIVRAWLSRLGVNALFIEPGSPWENGYIESFNGKLRDEHLNREVFDTVLEARVLTEAYRREYNTIRPHSSLNYRPPAPESWVFTSVTRAAGQTATPTH